MLHSPVLKRRLANASPVVFIIVTGLVAFTTYGCIYAFRKPFTAASFAGMEILGVQYKIALIIAQVAGYALSKFIGIGAISSLGSSRRAIAVLGMITMAGASLLGLALSPPSWGLFWMFLNGLPLGMGWGLIFSYLEGRRVTEALAAILCVNFILSSGFVKTVGKWIMLEWGVSEFWMPFTVALLFLPALFLGLWMLEHLPPPSEKDIEQRSQREPMTRKSRKMLFRQFAPGLAILILIYLILTMLRDIRDNFSVEIWTELGYGAQPAMLTIAEIPVAILALLFVAMLALIKNNARALWINHAIVVGGALLMLLSTLMFKTGHLSPVVWMIISGVGVFLPYILFNGVIFDRLLAAFRETGNVGFLIYLADSFGYLASVLILLWRNFGKPEVSWVQFFASLCLYGAVLILLAGGLSWNYFRFKYMKKKQLETEII
ncbi:MAG: hypothetical protein HUU01_06480 [Saprospiraceae bacterium]|nr:hypothetical protein [Saprospiraceae bacterium]